MNLTVRIPDALAQRLGADPADLERRTFAALVAAEYRAGRLTRSELQQILPFATVGELDEFLREHGLGADSRAPNPAERGAEGDLVARFRAFAAQHTLGGFSAKDLISEGRR
jgi:hypothetical protein